MHVDQDFTNDAPTTDLTLDMATGTVVLTMDSPDRATDVRWCELCAAKGIQSQLQIYQLNLDEAVILCPVKQCTYPVGIAGHVVIQERNAFCIPRPNRRAIKMEAAAEIPKRRRLDPSLPLTDALVNEEPQALLQSIVDPPATVVSTPKQISQTSPVLNTTHKSQSHFNDDSSVNDDCASNISDDSFVLDKLDLDSSKTAESKPLRKAFVHWRNNFAFCWLDVAMCILVHSPEVRRLTESNTSPKSLTPLLIREFDKAQVIFNNISNKRISLETSIGKVTVKTGGGDLNRKRPLVPNISEEPTLDKALKILEDAREEAWQRLQPKLRCTRGENDSPVFALPLILRESSPLMASCMVQYRWNMTCTECGYEHKDSVSRCMPTFPNVTSDFTMNDPGFVRDCFACPASNQKMKMEFEKLPSVLMVHFVEGLNNGDFSSYDFVHKGTQFKVSSIIQYKTNPNHFVAWIRGISDNTWMECDDLKKCASRTSLSAPKFPASQVHIVMWEQVKEGERLHTHPVSSSSTGIHLAMTPSHHHPVTVTTDSGYMSSPLSAPPVIHPVRLAHKSPSSNVFSGHLPVTKMTPKTVERKRKASTKGKTLLSPHKNVTVIVGDKILLVPRVEHKTDTSLPLSGSQTNNAATPSHVPALSVLGGIKRPLLRTGGISTTVAKPSSPPAKKICTGIQGSQDFSSPVPQSSKALANKLHSIQASVQLGRIGQASNALSCQTSINTGLSAKALFSTKNSKVDLVTSVSALVKNVPPTPGDTSLSRMERLRQNVERLKAMKHSFSFNAPRAAPIHTQKKTEPVKPTNPVPLEPGLRPQPRPYITSLQTFRSTSSNLTKGSSVKFEGFKFNDSQTPKPKDTKTNNTGKKGTCVPSNIGSTSSNRDAAAAIVSLPKIKESSVPLPPIPVAQTKVTSKPAKMCVPKKKTLPRSGKQKGRTTTKTQTKKPINLPEPLVEAQSSELKLPDVDKMLTSDPQVLHTTQNADSVFRDFSFLDDIDLRQPPSNDANDLDLKSDIDCEVDFSSLEFNFDNFV